MRSVRQWPIAFMLPDGNEDSSNLVGILGEDEVMKTLKNVACGETVTVTKLEGEGAVRRRIMDMGITKGASVYVRKVAPLGDPIEVTVRGYELSIRKADADFVLVQ